MQESFDKPTPPLLLIGFGQALDMASQFQDARVLESLESAGRGSAVTHVLIGGTADTKDVKGFFNLFVRLDAVVWVTLGIVACVGRFFVESVQLDIRYHTDRNLRLTLLAQQRNRV